MEQCIQMMAQAIQSGQLDPQMPVGALVEQMMGGGQEQPQEQQGLGGPVVAPQPGM